MNLNDIRPALRLLACIDFPRLTGNSTADCSFKVPEGAIMGGTALYEVRP